MFDNKSDYALNKKDQDSMDVLRSSAATTEALYWASERSTPPPKPEWQTRVKKSIGDNETCSRSPKD